MALEDFDHKFLEMKAILSSLNDLSVKWKQGIIFFISVFILTCPSCLTDPCPALEQALFKGILIFYIQKETNFPPYMYKKFDTINSQITL